MSGIACYWLDRTERRRIALRRFRRSDGPGHYHSAAVVIGDADADAHSRDIGADDPLFADPRWPTHCPCGEPFRDDDERQLFTEWLFRRADTGGLVVLREAEPGAMWDADWYPEKGPDGRSLVVVCPDGYDWHVDGRARNCTLPNDNEHRCWVREGEPPRITVSKRAPGQRTCSAGGGSIATPGYHGFLRDGRFT